MGNQKDNILQLFDGIDKKELKSINDFVNSPFYNKSKRLSDFFALIYKNYDVYKANGLSKKELAKKLYPGESYSKKTDEKIRKLLSDFGKLLDTYLITVKFMGNNDRMSLALIKTLRERGAEDRFKKKLNDLTKKLEKVKYKDEKHYKLESELVEEELKMEFADKMLKYSETDQRASDTNDHGFILTKLRTFNSMWTKQYYNKEKLDYVWSFYDAIKKYIEDNYQEVKINHPSIFLEYMTLKIFKYDDLNDFKEMKEFILKYSDIIPRTEYSDHSWNIISYASLMVNKGYIEYRKEVLEILKKLDLKDAIVNDEDLLPSEFKLAVDISIAERDLEWTGYFIKKYRGKIKKEYSNGLVNLSLAKLNFYANNFSKAKSYQEKVEYNDYIHYFDAKMLLAKIEFELRNFGNVLNSVETLKKFIKSHSELPDVYIKTYERFSVDVLQLIKLYENKFLGKDITVDRDIFIKNFNSNKHFIYSKDWFLEKIKLLKKEPELIS